MIDWHLDSDGQPSVERVHLADTDCAFKLGERLFRGPPLGNVMWRSPEAQTGKGIGKESDVFSYGLIVSTYR